MQFTRLRLSGFKSFVDPTELQIQNGLTGIVGPNGCGKSNLLEGLRWAMGEYRVKSLRGSGMDDVIFSGTDSRPARNLAEVTIFLDNSDRKAPAAFNDSPDLEVSRRIERESGSAYRMNGREVRAKDVQLLFADAATGARSPALVSQGKVGEVISAKPQDRRAILEEAAGIMGLHSRRKEAESRLRSAANNLLRLNDVMVQMEGQRSALKRQARQATRYKNISGDIRRAEANLFYVKWQSLVARISNIEGRLHKARRAVEKLTGSVAALTSKEADLAARVPDLRQKETEAAAALQRLIVERENLSLEEERKRARVEELEAQLRQIKSDQEREKENISDASLALERIDSELKGLDSDSDPESDKAARAKLQQAHEAANSAETAYDELATNVAREKVRHEKTAEDLASCVRKIDRFKAEKEKVEAELAAIAGKEGEAAPLRMKRERLKVAEKQRSEAEEELRRAEEARQKAADKRDEARQKFTAARAESANLEAEITGLRESLRQDANTGHVPIADTTAVEKGFEIALGVALGDDLEAPEAKIGSFGWQSGSTELSGQDLPEGAAPLSEFVRGPDTLAPRLFQTGLVDSSDGARLAKKLKYGQKLVTKDGELWRWDGFYKPSEIPAPAAVRMEQRNRIARLEEAKEEADAKATECEKGLRESEDAVDLALEAERAARKKRSQIDKSLAAARQELEDIESTASDQAAKFAALEEASKRIGAELVQSEAMREELEKASRDLPDLPDRESELEAARKQMESRRAALASARAEYDGLRRRRSEHETRHKALERDKLAWKDRIDRANKRIRELSDRQRDTEKEIEIATEDPTQAEVRRKALIDAIVKAEKRREAAADRLAELETKVGKAARNLKEEEARLAEAREEMARVETAFEAETARMEELAAAISEKFDCDPESLRDETGLKPDSDPPELEAVEKRLDRLRAERERLGAVNLRADIELEELAEQIDHLTGERKDLEAAIARLRQGIASINREGRERMLAAFEDVNQHFGELFSTLFDGGKAHLALVDSDDPLEAGLEIMASPPGKKLQSLSLLSGGEQALTAISLIFAVFMTNPAPICVLDEVDAPLDDANVERFCNLLDGISSRTRTRFLIVTHNAVTMARMDRLYGVTMAERGVSQLVSVDLETAEELRVAS